MPFCRSSGFLLPRWISENMSHGPWGSRTLFFFFFSRRTSSHCFLRSRTMCFWETWLCLDNVSDVTTRTLRHELRSAWVVPKKPAESTEANLSANKTKPFGRSGNLSQGKNLLLSSNVRGPFVKLLKHRGSCCLRSYTCCTCWRLPLWLWESKKNSKTNGTCPCVCLITIVSFKSFAQARPAHAPMFPAVSLVLG